MMLFSVNCETRKLIAVIRDIPSLIVVNCAHYPPLRPLMYTMWYERVSRWYENGWYEKTLVRKTRYSPP